MSKPAKTYRKRKIGEHVLKPESLVMGYGYDPAMSEGSIKPPIFMTSTFVFKSARDGEALFRQLAGKREELHYEEAGSLSELAPTRHHHLQCWRAKARRSWRAQFA